MVPEETEIREGAPEYTGRLCVIGSKLEEDKLAAIYGNPLKYCIWIQLIGA